MERGGLCHPGAMDSAHVDDVADRYAHFARFEVRERNPVYQAWSTGLAEDADTCELVATLPPLKRQPVLVFAAARHVGAPEVDDYASFRRFLHDNWAEIEQVALTHSTQTNEAARCGVLLPFLALLPGPLALVEVGCSAGLCLYPDRYSYRFALDDGAVAELGTGSPRLDCGLRDGVPAPRVLPEVVHRGGVDLHPLDPGDPTAAGWLHSLVWPGQHERLERLDAALDVAAADPPHVLVGDLVDRVEEAVAACPAGSTPVVFHTAVLAYLEPERRAEFVRRVSALDCVWISVEGVTILPGIEAAVPEKVRRNKGIFVVSVNGRPMATAHGHGAWVRALDPED